MPLLTETLLSLEKIMTPNEFLEELMESNPNFVGFHFSDDWRSAVAIGFEIKIRTHQNSPRYEISGEKYNHPTENRSFGISREHLDRSVLTNVLEIMEELEFFVNSQE